MATPYTSFGTRKALGRRYGVDPALLLESERLAHEYALAPGREARALQASQFGQGLALQREQMEGAERGGMVGTAGNLATTAGVLRAMTLPKGEPFFGGLFGGASGTGLYSTGATQVAPGAFALGGTYGAAGAVGLGGAGAAPFVVNPALMGEGAAGITAGAAPAGAGAAPAAGTGMGAYAGPAAAVAGIELGHQYITKPLAEKAADIFPGGKKEWGTVEKMGTRAAQGAVIGSVVPGVGTLVGAGAGALVGFVESIFGW